MNQGKDLVIERSTQQGQSLNQLRNDSSVRHYVTNRPQASDPPDDPEVAFYFTARAADSGDTFAAKALAERYYQGDGVARDVEQAVVVDRTAPLDFEIYQIESVTGIGADARDNQPIRPFFSPSDITPMGASHTAYYSQRRRLRQRSERQQQRGTRTSYLGPDVFLSLSDGNQAPFREDIRQLAVTALMAD